MKLFFVLILALSLRIFAGDKKHREHGAHVHGHAQLSIAFDNVKGQIEFKGASNGILGFEHIAKSKKDKKTLADVSDRIEKNISNYIQFDSGASCVFEKKTIGVVTDKDDHSHSDFMAQFEVKCAKSVAGTSLTLDFSDFKKLKEVDVTILIGELQLKSEVKTKKTTIDLK